MKKNFLGIFLSFLLPFLFSGCFFVKSGEQNMTTPVQEKKISQKKDIIPFQYSDPTQPVEIIFTGDIMLARYMRKTVEKRGIDFIVSQKITNFLHNADFVVINHEGVINGKNPPEPKPNMINFSFPENAAKIFSSLGITHATLGNNHSQDFGKDGENRTYQKLKNQNITAFGRSLNDIQENFSTRIEKNGKNISLLSYNDIFFDENLYKNFLQEITKEKKSPDVDVVIVLPHWGTEYFSGIEMSTQKKAHEMIDAGADIILGTHPHVVAPIEQYKEGIIFYSLGNFIFDQIFSESVKTGLLVTIKFYEHKTEFFLSPTKISDTFQISFVEGEEKKNFLQAVASVSKMPISTFGEIKTGIIHWKGF